MNQIRCKQLKPNSRPRFEDSCHRFCTATVEKAVSFQTQTTVQLRTSTGEHCHLSFDVHRWDGKAGLPRDAVRSQVIRLEAQEVKGIGSEEG
jgi:hypothetical protein